MVRTDPCSMPFVTLVRPFIVAKLKGTLSEQKELLKYVRKDFAAYSVARVKEDPRFQVEVRFIRLSATTDGEQRSEMPPEGLFNCNLTPPMPFNGAKFLDLSK